MTNEEFLSKATKHLIDRGVTILLQSTQRVEGSCGYYCGEDKTLAVATDHSFDSWFQVFIHEYCHFIQDEDPKFRDKFDYPDYYWVRYFSWLDGHRKCASSTIAKYVHGIRAVEMDCEKRVVKLIKKFSLPIDVGEYVQRANAYGYFYTLTKETGQWYGETAPSDYANAWKLLPTSFVSDYEKVPESYRKLVLSHCF